MDETGNDVVDFILQWGIIIAVSVGFLYGREVLLKRAETLMMQEPNPENCVLNAVWYKCYDDVK